MTMQTQNFYLGNGVATATLTLMTRSNTGVLTTSGSAVSLLASFEDITWKRFFELERASITASAFANNVKTETGTDVDITGFILKNDVYSTSTTNPMGYAFDVADYVQVVYIRAGLTWTYVGIWETYQETTNKKAPVKFTGALKMVDIGGPNPLLS